MQKTKLGISVGLLGAAICFLGLFGGYIALIIAAGYVLLVETNEWLRKTAVKVSAIVFMFSILSVLVGLIPDAIGLISSFLNIFGGSFHISFISTIIAFVNTALSVIEKVILLWFGFKALTQGTISMAPFDGIVEKHTNL